MLTTITPSEFLEHEGACDIWLARARGTTWRQMFALIERFHQRAPAHFDGSPLSWLIYRLDPAFADGNWACAGCLDSHYACLLGLPFEAWMDAIEAYAARGPPPGAQMTPAPEKQCSVVYQGKSFPQFHGTQCTKDAPHYDERHFALVDGHAVSWWTEAEKQTRRAG